MSNVDLNTASVEELSQMAKVGRERAEEIIRVREERGGFKSWDDVKSVPGVSDEVVNNLRQSGAKL